MPSLLPHRSQASTNRPAEGSCLPPWAWSPLPTDSWSPVHLFLLKPTQKISRGSSVSLGMVLVATWHASTTTGCIQAGSPVCVCPGLRLLPDTLPQAGLRPVPRREGVGWVSSWVVCLHSLPTQGSTVTQACLCWEWACRPPPPPGKPPRALRPRPSAVGQFHALLK